MIFNQLTMASNSYPVSTQEYSFNPQDMGLKTYVTVYHIQINVNERKNLINLYSFYISTLCLTVSSADNFCRQFGPRSGLTRRQS